MKAKQLIEENNKKREQLTPENEKYYSDMLIYIRLQLTLSEQQSEEVLMEMLDHLLDGQNEGKSARDIFGDDPKGYADEIIQNLPKEQKRSVIPFIMGIVLNLLSWMLMIRGVVIPIASQLNKEDVSSSVYLYPTLLTFAVIIGSVAFGVWYIFRIIKQSLFNEKASEKKDMVKAGVFGAVAMGLVIAVTMFMPEFGPSFHFSWWASLLTGGVLWLVVFLFKKFEVWFK
ncbi:putative membrane-anchored protein [Neobacillus niacini]|uniref:DUF1129 family protein n=1 Tax=Neobacillus niacini TaxID=86668 RepID=UPI002863C063|nr:DUF1129 family protein [Neobacillus niacini]MDR7079613.1 putative membrane-anchored protein [Neobacillus niacini]